MKILDIERTQSGGNAVPPSEQSSGEPENPNASAPSSGCEPCVHLLHDLNNAFAGVLMNAQVMDGKLPSYSRSKRYVHEIERSALRGGELVKRLLLHLASTGVMCSAATDFESVPPVADTAVLVANQEPPARSSTLANLPRSSPVEAAPAFAPALQHYSHGDVTHALARNSQKGTISTKVL